MRVVLIEDDPDQARKITTALRKAFDDLEVRLIESELEFRDRVDELISPVPAVILMDVMVRKVPKGAPDDVELALSDEDAFHQAGFRCEKLLRARSMDVPVIIYSVLDREDLTESLAKVSSRTRYIRKEYHLHPLINQIRTFLEGATRS